MMESGSPVTVTVFCLDVCPEVTSAPHPVTSRNSLTISRLALPSSGGVLTLTTMRPLHSSNPSIPERLDLGDTDTSTLTYPSQILQTSATLMRTASAHTNMSMSEGLFMPLLMAFR